MKSLYKPLIAWLGMMAATVTFASAPAVARVQHHPKPLPARKVAMAETAHPALWKVQQGNTTVYLFGTVHALPAGVDWLHGSVAQAFDRSDALVTEIIEQSPEAMRKIVFAKAMLPEGESLRGILPRSTRLSLEKALKANGLPEATLDRYRPWYAAVALSTLPLMKSGYDPANGVDSKLSALAKNKALPHEAFETAEYQLGLFDSLPLPLQKTYLKEVAAGAPKIATELGAMISAWKAGNAAKLAQLMNADASDARLAEVLLIGRNRLWAQAIKARLDKNAAAPSTVFVAVGAGHLAGKGSLQDQLKRLGINAIRVQ